jgi:copper transport protein
VVVRLVAFTMVSMVVAMWGSDVSAHAVLVRTGPFDGAVVARAPPDVTLRFNEPVAPVFVHVVGAAGAIGLREPPRAEGSEIRLRLPGDLADGGYLVSWRVVSVDSHPIAGSFAFSIGDAAPAPSPRTTAAEAARDSGWRIAKIVARLVANVALMLAAGGMIFALFVLRDEAWGSISTGIVGPAGALALVGAVVSVGVEGGVVRPGPADILLDIDTWRYGWATTVGKSAVVLVAGIALLAAGRLMRDRTLALVGAIGATESLALTGHSAASSWVVQLALMIHVSAAAYWLGSLWPLRQVLRSASAADAQRVVRRFSAIAIPGAVLLAAAAFVVASSRVESILAAIHTSYGRLLALKILLVLGLLAVAAVNRQRLTPALVVEPERAAPRLRRNIAVEIALAAAILIVTAIVAHTPPPAAELHARHSDRSSAAAIRAPERDEVVVVANEERGYVAKIAMSPARAGSNAIVVELWAPDGRQPAALEVTAELSRPEARIEPLLRKLTADGGKRYVNDRLPVPLAGRWSVRIDALISDFDSAVFETEVVLR